MISVNKDNLKCHRHRAAGYLLVLGATMLLTVIGYASLMTARINTRLMTGNNDWAEAGALALAGTELAPVLLANNADWRTTYTSGTPFSLSLDRNEVTIVLVDEDDGDFSTEANQPVRAYGIGMVGDALRARSVLLQPNTSVPMDCLGVSMHSVDDVTMALSRITSNQIVSTSGSVTGVLAELYADVEYVGSVGGVAISGTQTKVSVARTVPDPVSVFEYYVANGTVIPLEDLPVVNGSPTINETVLTADFNPITGEVNAQGIYVIDCAGGTVVINNSRLEATLVLLNAEGNDMAPHCRATGKVFWRPAVPNFPVVLAQGNFDMTFDGRTTMVEADIGVNFNPVGAEYLGDADADLDDEYPSVIAGLIYSTGGGGFPSGYSHLRGLFVTEGKSGAAVSAEARITYDGRYLSEAPPGFSTGPYEPLAGTWRWDTPPTMTCQPKFGFCTNDSDCCSNNCNTSFNECMP